MINVEDGDAIILTLKDNDRKALILIDGGYKTYYPKVKKRIEELLPGFNTKIDLLICTHYDNDHIGGVENILDDYHSIIQEIWMHKIEASISEEISFLTDKVNHLGSSLLLEDDKIIKSVEGYSNNLVLEGYRDLLRVVEKIKKYGLEQKVVQAMAGTKFKKFPEFSVVSPTLLYYNQNLPSLKKESLLEDLRSNIKNKSTNFPRLIELYMEGKEDIGEPQDYCELLEKSSLSNNVTATNMVSIVTLLEANEKKFLFTGDAGIESFELHTPQWTTNLKDLFFLDVPHHGSKNNTSKKMLDVFNPKYAFVSAKGATNRPSKFIEKCMQSKRRLETFETTNSIDNTWYLRINQDGFCERKMM